ncbi:hypothetical protein GZH47_02795 [Paenibacillus rhizovicinus]|uniref:Carboxypeptidase regulatory-like domain-containing protein n=1 Tax=Paenibacillus rhizovicinus TaxID=2704463 RepID=A0A6C0NZF9_9BACL|nr:hypothetical protein [Paenibacillus rhizovicinus]QHW29862.1 hypothetical protein GZH47_02795 [Paenibacillus rhizovicinus]
MKLKIRVKVKHLVMGLVSASLLIGFGYKAMPIMADLAGVDPSGWDADASKWKHIQKDVLNDGSDTLTHAFQVYVGPDNTFGTGIPGIKPKMPWDAKLPLLISYVEEGPAAGTYLSQAAKQLALYYSLTGENDKAIQVLETAERRLGKNETYQLVQLQVEQAQQLFQLGEYEQAEGLLDEIQKQMLKARLYSADLDVRIAQLKAKILMRQGKLSQALDDVNRQIASSHDGPSSRDAKQDGGSRLEQLEALRRVLQERSEELKGASLSVVSGTVIRSDGTPMAHAGVFLRTQDAINHSLTETEPYQMMTDDQGRYSFADVLPGAYQLALGFDYDQIDGWVWPVNYDEWIDVAVGKDVTYPVVLQPLMSVTAPVNNAVLTGDGVTFSWQPVEGAAYYKLLGTIDMKDMHGTSSIGVTIHDRIPGHAVHVPMDTLYNVTSGFAYNTIDDKLVPDPFTLLAFAYPGKRFAWNVEAYDSKGNKLTQSNGYRLTKNTMGDLPFFSLKARTLTQADQLLLDNRVDDAMAAYKSAWESDHTDAYSLGKIIKLYGVLDEDDRSNTTSKQELLPYELHMAELNPRLSDCYWLMEYYRDLRDWDRVRQYYELGLGLDQYDSVAYIKSEYASALLSQGKIDEALELLAEVVPQDNNHEEIGPYLAADIYVSGSLAHAMTIAELYPEREIGESKVTDWLKLLQMMKAESIEKSAYMKELKQALLWQCTGRQDELDQWDKSADYRAMGHFLSALANKID